MGRTGWVAVRAGGRCQPRGTQQGPRAESHWDHLMGEGGGGEAAAGKASGGHMHKSHRKTRGTSKSLGAEGPPDPPVPSASLPSGSSVSGGPPRLSVLPAPSAPRRGPPWGPPSRRGRISLFTLSASQLPFLGARGHKRGVRPRKKEDTKAMSGVAKARPTLTWAWTRAGPGLRGQGRGEVGKTSGPPGWRGPLTWSGAGAQAPAHGIGP